MYELCWEFANNIVCTVILSNQLFVLLERCKDSRSLVACLDKFWTVASLLFVGFQYGTLCIWPFWRVEFWAAMRFQENSFNLTHIHMYTHWSHSVICNLVFLEIWKFIVVWMHLNIIWGVPIRVQALLCNKTQHFFFKKCWYFYFNIKYAHCV
jgi:hypothetical protein